MNGKINFKLNREKYQIFGYYSTCYVFSGKQRLWCWPIQTYGSFQPLHLLFTDLVIPCVGDFLCVSFLCFSDEAFGDDCFLSKLSLTTPFNYKSSHIVLFRHYYDLTVKTAFAFKCFISHVLLTCFLLKINNLISINHCYIQIFVFYQFQCSILFR